MIIEINEASEERSAARLAREAQGAREKEQDLVKELEKILPTQAGFRKIFNDDTLEYRKTVHPTQVSGILKFGFSDAHKALTTLTNHLLHIISEKYPEALISDGGRTGPSEIYFDDLRITCTLDTQLHSEASDQMFYVIYVRRTRR